MFNAGFRPAVNPGISVSRVGGSAQIKAMKKIAGPIRIDLEMCIRDRSRRAGLRYALAYSGRRNLYIGKRAHILYIECPVSYTHLDVYKRQG